jgi:hypothetical protein
MRRTRVIAFMVTIALLILACGCAASGTGTEPAADTGGDKEAPTAAPSTTYTVIDTGQTACYDDSSEIVCPGEGQPFYGQDAQYDGNQPAYQENGDGTVTDLNTGLMWQKTPV